MRGSIVSSAGYMITRTFLLFYQGRFHSSWSSAYLCKIIHLYTKKWARCMYTRITSETMMNSMLVIVHLTTSNRCKKPTFPFKSCVSLHHLILIFTNLIRAWRCNIICFWLLFSLTLSIPSKFTTVYGVDERTPRLEHIVHHI